jgi:hypothetical protein
VRLTIFLSLFVTVAAVAADVRVQRIADDAKVVDRIAEVAKKDFPDTLVKRLVTEDIELLRGRRSDGSYEYATFERLESGRVSSDFSIHPPKKEGDLQKVEMKGSFVYRLIITSPARRMMVTKNRRVWLGRADVEYVPIGSSSTRVQSFKLEKWIEPNETIPLDLQAVARQATARVYARGDEAAGYGNIVLTLVEAKVVDNADSPYADAVASARAILRGVESSDLPSIRAMAARMYESLAPGLASNATTQASVDVVAPRVEPPATNASPEIFSDLQKIEDLLTGSETERRQGVDELHQLIRRLRNR